jgi:DNA sulfur modification protein DndE
MAIEHIRLSQQARDQLLRLKRTTGIKHWNVLCRWAFVASLAEPGVPAPARAATEGGVEMSWKVFGGEHHDAYLALLKARCDRDGLGTKDDVLAAQLRYHLHRGIGYLFADKRLRDVSGLFRRIKALDR